MHHGDCYLHQRNRTDMGSQIMALLLFWLPGIFLLVGILIYLLKKPEQQKKYGLLCAFISFGMILSTPWTLSASDSSAFGHFLGMVPVKCKQWRKKYTKWLKHLKCQINHENGLI